MANQITIENARLIWRNFSGTTGEYNRNGQRNFNVILDRDFADFLSKEGFNVKRHEPREEGDDPLFTLKVIVNFNNERHRPKVVQVTRKGQTMLDEDSICILDSAECEKIDLIINPSPYDVNGKKGISAYLKTLYATLVEDELELKYSNDDYGD